MDTGDSCQVKTLYIFHFSAARWKQAPYGVDPSIPDSEPCLDPGNPPPSQILLPQADMTWSRNGEHITCWAHSAFAMSCLWLVVRLRYAERPQHAKWREEGIVVLSLSFSPLHLCSLWCFTAVTGTGWQGTITFDQTNFVDRVQYGMQWFGGQLLHYLPSTPPSETALQSTCEWKIFGHKGRVIRRHFWRVTCQWGGDKSEGVTSQ